MTIRYDKIDFKATITNEGWIRDTPIVTRSGIFEYKNNAGKVVREYRPEKEVFSVSSLSSLRGIPITNGHRGLITADNAEGILGTVVSEGRKDEADSKNVVSEIVIYSPKQLGKCRELSLGYDTTLVNTPGVTEDGQKYDAIQTNIVYNHLAVVNKGRAGNARLRLDSNDAASFVVENTMSDSPKMVSVRLDGIEYQASPEVARALEKFQEQVITHKKSFDTLQAERDGFNTQVSETVKVLRAAITDSADAPGEKATVIDLAKYVADAAKNVETKIKARMELEETAKKHDVKFDAKDTDRKIRESILAAVSGTTVKFDDKSDDYVSSAFDFAMNTESVKSLKIGEQRVASSATTKTQSSTTNNVGANAARARMVTSIRAGRSF